MPPTLRAHDRGLSSESYWKCLPPRNDLNLKFTAASDLHDPRPVQSPVESESVSLAEKRQLKGQRTCKTIDIAKGL
jgi:hypothetical protein